jgi:hypothetical protein
MKEEIMNEVQGLPKAAESNTKNGREKTQKAQEQISTFATFVLFRGYCVNVNPPAQSGCQAAKLGLPAIAVAAKAGQTDLLGQVGGKTFATTLT